MKIVAKTRPVSVALSLILLMTTGSASAHTSIAETNPADGSTVEAAPPEVKIRFGDASLPPQPGQITDGRLEVFDACGTQVDEGDSQANMEESSVTVSSGGDSSGRYEAHWYATAADGQVQSGIFDFNVSGGSTCENVTRTDPKEDVDVGFDVTSITTRKVRRGVQARIGFATPVKCSDLGDKDLDLSVYFDTNSDRAADTSGRITCAAGKTKLTFKGGAVPATRPTSDSVAFVIRPHVLLGSIEFYVESLADKEECEDKVCSELAPDLGLVNVR